MERVTLDASLSHQLCGSPLPVELCDAGGQSLGFFVPSKAAYASITLPISEDELAAREQTTGGRTWQEIRFELERKYGPVKP